KNPICSRPGVNVGFSGYAQISFSADHECLATQANGRAEQVIRQPVCGGELLLLRPGRSRARESVHTAPSNLRPHIPKPIPNKQRISFNGEAIPERTQIVRGRFTN